MIVGEGEFSSICHCSAQGEVRGESGAVIATNPLLINRGVRSIQRHCWRSKDECVMHSSR
jgi:hypothetical protein